MQWRKVKNIILLILVALNLALAALVLGPQLSDHYHQSRADREAVRFLEQKGIDLKAVELPDPELLPPMRVERDRESEQRLAEAVLGADAREQARGGGVYRYTGQAGVLQFHSDGSFMLQLSPGQVPVGEDPAAAALSVLEQMEYTGVCVAADENSVSVEQQWQGIALFTQQATVSWDETGVIGVEEGRRLYGLPVADESRQTVTLATALIGFYNGLNQMGDVCSRVDAIRPGYVSAASLERRMTLTPVWRVTTDTGAYQLDLVSGELTRVD